MVNDDILPCPFCGGREVELTEDEGCERVAVRCKACFALSNSIWWDDVEGAIDDVADAQPSEVVEYVIDQTWNFRST